jgi:hypothetical protein
MWIEIHYITYLGAAALIFWLARIFHRAGALFLNDAFVGNPVLTRLDIQLLDVGF